MRCLVAVLGIALLCPLGGCGSSEDTERLVASYRYTLGQQLREQQKILSILESAKDRPSMAEALKQLRAEYERAAAHPRRLPPPEIKERLSDEYAKLEEAGSRVFAEFRRIGDLPGGQEFFDEVKKLKPPQGPSGP
jgi:hypothetical protein